MGLWAIYVIAFHKLLSQACAETHKPTAFLSSVHKAHKQTNPQVNSSVQSFLDEAFNRLSSFTSDSQNNNENQDARKALKESLLLECQSSKGNISEKEQRQKIEAIINDLSKLSPIKETAASSRIQKPWLLVWTTEKEVNFFNDWGISNGNITQTISPSMGLSSNIPFTRGGSLSVDGTLSLSEGESLRTYFEFTTAVLDLGKWGQFGLPPVGKGWFDTVYLDDDLRIDLNSRNDILICSPL